MLACIKLLLAWAQLALSALPKCTWESCPVCFEDAKTDLANLELQGFDGKAYMTPFRFARANNFWNSQSFMNSVLAILFSEKLGINTSFSSVLDEYETMKALLGCTGYKNGLCDEQVITLGQAQSLYAEGEKVWPDTLPDIFVSLEVWPGALIPDELEVTDEQLAQGNYVGYGSSGFLLKEWLWVVPEAASTAWTTKKKALTNYLVWTTSAIKDFISTPQVYMEAGVGPEFPGCPGDPDLDPSILSGFDILLGSGYVCKEAWWLTPACAAFGDDWKTECAGVLDDDWGYPKPVVYNALSALNMRVAKLIVGYDGMKQVLLSKRFNASFLWWDTDTQFVTLNPLGVQLQKAVDTESLIIQKIAWTPAAKYSTKIDTLLNGVSISNANLNTMLKMTADAEAAGNTADEDAQPGFFSKLACEWLRTSEAVWTSWLPDPTSCDTGQIFNKTLEACEPCPSGSYYTNDVSGRRCEVCPLGTAQPLIGQRECTKCEPGTFAAKTGLKTCTACQVGSFSDADGQSVCVSCAAGRKRGHLWTSVSVVRSEGGTIAYFPTDKASNISQCGCKPGAWMHGSECEDCLEGMACRGGFGFEVAPGFYSTEEDPTKYYLCMDSKNCMGGEPGTCPGDRIGLMCEACPEGEASAPHQKCLRCKDKSNSLLLGLTIAYLPAIGVIAHVYHVKNQGLSLNMSPMSGFLTLVGAQVGMFQLAGIIGSSPVEWPKDFKPILDVTRLFMIDIDFLDIRCGVGSSDVGHYAVRVAIFFYLFVAVWVCHLVTQPFRCIRWQWRATANFSGQIFLVTFTTMVALSAFPMSCYSHPNGLTSTREYPSVICGTTDHLKVLCIGLVLFFISIFVAAALVFLVWQAPSLSLSSLRTLVFVINNFRAEVWYWSIIRVLRSVLLAMTQVVFPSDGVLQVFTFSFILLMSSILQAILLPWKMPVMNWADLGMTGSLTLVVFLSAMSMVTKPDTDSHTSGALMTSMMVLMLATTALAGVRVMIMVLKPNTKVTRAHLRALIDAYYTVSGEISKQTPETLTVCFSELAVYDLTALKNAAAILESCGLNNKATPVKVQASLRLAPLGSSEIADVVANAPPRASFDVPATMKF